MPGYFSWGGLSLKASFPVGSTPSDAVLHEAVAALNTWMEGEADDEAAAAGDVLHGDFSSATFEAQLEAALAPARPESPAVLVQPDGGDLAGRMFAVVDGNGDGQFQAAGDYVLEYLGPAAPLDTVATCIA